MVQSHPGQIVYKTLPQKHPSQKRPGGVAQCDSLSSNSTTAKKKKKKSEHSLLKELD
jgi:hypothetical protein